VEWRRRDDPRVVAERVAHRAREARLVVLRGHRASAGSKGFSTRQHAVVTRVRI
jgi:hypothetical protein